MQPNQDIPDKQEKQDDNLLDERMDAPVDGGEAPVGGENNNAKQDNNLLDEGMEAPADGGIDDVPSDEVIANFRSSINSLSGDLGLDEDGVKDLLPELYRLSGGDAEKADRLVKKYGSVVKNGMDRIRAKDTEFNRQLVESARSRFGSELQKVVKFANIGGRDIFGDELWSVFRKIPAFANNPDVLERLARRGRIVEEDNGVYRGGHNQSTGDQSDVIHRMYGGMKI